MEVEPIRGRGGGASQARRPLLNERPFPDADRPEYVHIEPAAPDSQPELQRLDCAFLPERFLQRRQLAGIPYPEPAGIDRRASRSADSLSLSNKDSAIVGQVWACTASWRQRLVGLLLSMPDTRMEATSAGGRDGWRLAAYRLLRVVPESDSDGGTPCDRLASIMLMVDDQRSGQIVQRAHKSLQAREIPNTDSAGRPLIGPRSPRTVEEGCRGAVAMWPSHGHTSAHA